MFINHNRCLIEGTAGTGKTFIAIEAVKRALNNGNVLPSFVTTQSLADG
jgi:DNA replication protein DnaC